jgi:hypothetical protein
VGNLKKPLNTSKFQKKQYTTIMNQGKIGFIQLSDMKRVIAQGKLN